ncbi:hypothetical protein Tco_0574785, partial [Tanacetum coccineum]
LLPQGVAFSSLGFALDLPRLSSLTDLFRCGDVLLLEPFPMKQALPFVQDVPKDSLESRSDRFFVSELSELSSSYSS